MHEPTRVLRKMIGLRLWSVIARSESVLGDVNFVDVLSRGSRKRFNWRIGIPRLYLSHQRCRYHKHSKVDFNYMPTYT